MDNKKSDDLMVITLFLFFADCVSREVQDLLPDSDLHGKNI